MWRKKDFEGYANFFDSSTHLFRDILLIWRLDLFLSVYMGFSRVCRIYIIPREISSGIFKRKRNCYGMVYYCSVYMINYWFNDWRLLFIYMEYVSLPI